MARGNDRILWLPAVYPESSVRVKGMIIHRCPTAVLPTPTTRETLDWMALGTCRYCKEPLPE